MIVFFSNRSVAFLLALVALSTPHLSCGAPDERKLAANLKNKDIPWKDLVRRLSKEAKLIKGSAKAFAKQCDPGFDKPQWERTENIFDAKSGLCLDAFACAFENCLPNTNHSLSVYDNLHAMYSSTVEDVEKWKDPSNPEYALPSSVLFPKTAGDIVAAVEFANDNKLELSVKSSGHNYSGQSSKKDTLLLNTKRFQKYAATGIVECDAGASSTILSDLSNQPCVLAVARKKEAYIRVATGEPFLDLYGAVHDFNEAQDEYKYHVVGGAHPTVTPMGWTFQGGMAATAMGRFHGYGVDQVLLIEAVLPTGEFVRFGPTSYEDAEGFRVPKTLAVSGVCNQNPFDDEESWVWGPCAKDINFDDLWYAFRGGGGGTYGIATSLFLQLHEYRPLESVAWKPLYAFNKTQSCDLPQSDLLGPNGILAVYAKFMMDFILEPEKVGVTEEESSVCGQPQGSFLLTCYGNGSGSKFVSAWKNTLKQQRDELSSNGIPESSIDAASNCLDDKIYRMFPDLFSGLQEEDESFMGPTPFPRNGDFNSGYLLVDPFQVTPNYLVSFDTYKSSPDDWYKYYVFALENGIDNFYHVVGGVGVNHAHDQMTSLPKGFRKAAFYTTTVVPVGFQLYESWIENGFIAPNHMHPHVYGPLKEDNTTVCPLNDFTFAQADELCYSSQEATWGLEVLARLEKIKATVDPNHILNCNKCVGYKKDSIAEYKPSKKKPKKSGKSRRLVNVQ